MKKLSIVFLFLLFYSALEAQILPNDPMSPPFIVVLDTNMAPADPFIINSDDPPLTNLTAMRVTIITDSIDIYVEDLRLFIERQSYQLMNQMNQPNIKSVSLYDGATLLAKKTGQDSWYQFGMQKITIEKFSQKTLTFKFDEISGSGIIIPRLVLVQASGQTTGYYIFDKEVVGARFNFVDPDFTSLSLYRAPVLFSDTMYVYPGQYWYLYHQITTKMENYLPRTIQAIDCKLIHDQYGQQNYFNGYEPYYPYGGFPSGYVYRESITNALAYKWYADSVGVDQYESFYVNKVNPLPVNYSLNFWLNDRIVLSSPYFKTPRYQTFQDNTTITCIDGIRGDVTGDGIVNYDDLALIVKEDHDNSLLFNKQKIDLGRSLILFDWPAEMIDAWVLNRWLVNPNNPLVANLGIGKLMSERVEKPLLVPFTNSLNGDVLIINTTGQAVMVTTILPDGKMWKKDVWVNNGSISIVIPDPALRYRIQSVQLSATTDIQIEDNAPTAFNLSQNYPNPFNPSTAISYSLPKSSFVNLKVYDILGKEVAVLVNEEKTEGNYSVNFDGSKLASGTYLCRLVSGAFIQTKKMVLMK